MKKIGNILNILIGFIGLAMIFGQTSDLIWGLDTTMAGTAYRAMVWSQFIWGVISTFVIMIIVQFVIGLLFGALSLPFLKREKQS